MVPKGGAGNGEQKQGMWLHLPRNTTGRGVLRFIDLFAGIGGMRLAFEQASRTLGVKAECVLTSEIKPSAIGVLRQNWPGNTIRYDIRQITNEEVPPFNVLLGGFPCQAFSYAGKRRGFADTRGTLFFEIARLLAAHRPRLAIMENVEGLVKHDLTAPGAKMGRTLATIIETLEELSYSVSWRILDAADFGVAQRRKRIYIVAHRGEKVNLNGFPHEPTVPLGTVLESGLPTSSTPFVRRVLARYTPDNLYGKAFKDKRGGNNNIHSWDLELKGPVTSEERALLDVILRSRRYKRWAEEYGIAWMDGMPMTEEQIAQVYPNAGLSAMLADLTAKGYLKREHPKRLVATSGAEGQIVQSRIEDSRLPLGYNIATGKLSFPITQVLDPCAPGPTLVATDMARLHVVDGTGLRPLTLREGLRLFGYPDSFKFDVPEQAGYDLLGNTVAVPAMRAVCCRALAAWEREGGIE